MGEGEIVNCGPSWIDYRPYQRIEYRAKELKLRKLGKNTMTKDEIQYKAFLIVWKVLGQVRPGITNEERLITAIMATSDDKFERAKRLHPSKVAQLSKIELN